MKQLKDFLHYYLGCEVQVSHPEFSHPQTYKFIGIKPLDFGEPSKQPVVVSDSIYNYAYENVKPILRRLEDMTQEEAISFVSISIRNLEYTNVKVHRNHFGDLIVTWGGLKKESRDSYNATGERTYSGEQFQWLLSHGFDPFNLIASNLAIDRKTLSI